MPVEGEITLLIIVTTNYSRDKIRHKTDCLVRPFDLWLHHFIDQQGKDNGHQCLPKNGT